MSYQVLARKWRPSRFQDVVGQEHVLRALVNALDQQRLHHAYLFTGTRGVGKTTLARILARCLNCDIGVSSQPCGVCPACCAIGEGRFVDLIEVDAASRTKVDDTRELLDNVQYAPTHARYKVYLIDEVHMLSSHSFNALLKTLEEPPPHVKFLLATTDPQKLPITVLSRCLQFNLKRVPEEQISAHLEHVLTDEAVSYDSRGLLRLARAAEGSLRDALSLLDQAIAFGGGSVALDAVEAMLGHISQDHLHSLLGLVAQQDAESLMQRVAELAALAPDYDTVLADLITLLHDLALAQVIPGALSSHDGDAPQITALAAQLGAEDLQLFYEIALKARRELEVVPDPRQALEMALLRMLLFKPAKAGASNPPGRAKLPSSAKPSLAGRPSAGSTAGAPQATTDAVKAVVRPAAIAATIAPHSLGSDWEAVLEQCDMNRMVKLLASHCTLRHREPGLLQLQMSRKHEQLHSEATLQKLAQALSNYFGEATRVRVDFVDEMTESPAEKLRRVATERQLAAEDSIARDPIVESFKDTFGAVVVPGTIRPLEH
ncbi:MAG: DNA polymerase III subunit gamma/tau [Thiotrichales bacterium]